MLWTNGSLLPVKNARNERPLFQERASAKAQKTVFKESLARKRDIEGPIRTKSSWMSKTLIIQYTYKYEFFCPSINPAFSA